MPSARGRSRPISGTVGRRSGGCVARWSVCSVVVVVSASLSSLCGDTACASSIVGECRRCGGRAQVMLIYYGGLGLATPLGLWVGVAVAVVIVAMTVRSGRGAFRGLRLPLAVAGPSSVG